MSLKGLGSKNTPFLYLDEYCPTINWEELHAETCYGLSSVQWIKRYVSAGVHEKWSDKEMTTYARNRMFSDIDLSYYDKILPTETEKRIKFTSLTTPALHPFWTLFLRLNRVVDNRRMSNKSVASDCEWNDNIKHFPKLVELINQLPFKEIGRVMFFITEPNNETIPHYDDSLDVPDRPNDDFIWFTTNNRYKKIYVMNPITLEKSYPDQNKKFIWFNEMDYHGTDAINRLSFSIRIDGKFHDHVKRAIID